MQLEFEPQASILIALPNFPSMLLKAERLNRRGNQSPARSHPTVQCPYFCRLPAHFPHHLSVLSSRDWPEDPVCTYTKGCCPFLCTFNCTTCINPTKPSLCETKQSKAAKYSIGSTVFPHVFVQYFSSRPLRVAILQWWPQHAEVMAHLYMLYTLLSFSCVEIFCGTPIGPDDAFDLANVYVILGWGRKSRHITLNRSVGNTLATHWTEI